MGFESFFLFYVRKLNEVRNNMINSGRLIEIKFQTKYSKKKARNQLIRGVRSGILVA